MPRVPQDAVLPRSIDVLHVVSRRPASTATPFLRVVSRHDGLETGAEVRSLARALSIDRIAREGRVLEVPSHSRLSRSALPELYELPPRSARRTFRREMRAVPFHSGLESGRHGQFRPCPDGLLADRCAQDGRMLRLPRRREVQGHSPRMRFLPSRPPRGPPRQVVRALPSDVYVPSGREFRPQPHPLSAHRTAQDDALRAMSPGRQIARPGHDLQWLPHRSAQRAAWHVMPALSFDDCVHERDRVRS